MVRHMQRAAIAGVLALLMIALLSGSGATLAAGPGGYTWVWENPLPNGESLYSTSALSATAVWSVGAYGTIFYWNGTRLTQQNSGTSNNLYGVYAQDATHVWAVGEAGTILFYNGTTWAPQGTGVTTYDLLSVSAAVTNRVWAVGGYDGFNNAVILYYNGTTWTVQLSQATGGFTDVYAYDATHVWAVSIWTWFYNGTTWTKVNDGDSLAGIDPYQISGYSTTNLWAVGWSGKVLSSSNAGTTWNEAPSPPDTGTSYGVYWPSSLSALDATHIYAVGWGGSIAMYNGTAWATQDGGTTNDLNDVDAFNNNSIFTCGEGACFLSYATPTWLNRTGGTTSQLNAIHGRDANNLWTVGTKVGTFGNIQSTTDGGNIWNTQSSGTTNTLYGVDYLDATHLWVCGKNRICFWNGTAWTQQYGATRTLYCISAAATNRVWAGEDNGRVCYYNGTTWTEQTTGYTNALYGIYAADTTHVWAVGASGRILYTSNAGTNWAAQTSNTTNTIRAVTGLNATTAWAVGDAGTIRYTNNAGATWQTQASGTANALYGVSAADATHVWAVGAGGTILFYDGTSWAPQTSPTTNILRAVFAYDANNAWAVGNNGTIIFADPPYIKACAPGWGNPGDTVDVEVIGGYTHFQASTPTLSFGTGVNVVPGSVNVVDNTHILAQVQVESGAALGPRDVNATTAGETPIPLTGGFVVGATPTIASISKASAPRGWTGDVEITGSQTSFSAASQATFGSGVTVNGITCRDIYDVTANITVSASAAPGPRSVNVTTGSETPAPLADAFTVATPPNVTGVSPGSGPTGLQVTVTGSDFGPDMWDSWSKGGFSQVSFDGTPATDYSSWSDTSITCRVPGGAGTGPVTVDTANGASNSNIAFSPTSPTWYLAEGSTAWGFNTEITVMNPNNTAVTIRPTFMTGAGRTVKPDITLPANSTRVIDPGNDYGLLADLSTKIECLEGKSIAVDRTMYWLGEGAAASEGHTSIGVTSPSNTWYLAEGSSAWGFESWLLIQNPGATDANCRLTYMVQGGAPVTVNKTVPANSRGSFNMAYDIGAADASIEVRSNVPVIAERSMYRDNRREGSNSIGATAPSPDFYLAEGSTNWGFTTYVLVQNPNPTPTDVTVTYMTPSGPSPQPPVTIPANSRQTVNANDAVPGTDLSVRVHGTQPIVAERAMYWDSPSGQACHDSIGLDAPHRVFYLPGGQSGYGFERWFETWTLIQNPNDVDVKVKVSYLTNNGTHNASFIATIPANSRKTFNMADLVRNERAGVVVECTTAGRKVMVERSTYWDNEPGGRSAGANTIGGFSD